tara:strand:+ start:153 stop:422 length:270 start_codon:yes stop_codon:yes gene_type:complete
MDNNKTDKLFNYIIESNYDDEDFFIKVNNIRNIVKNRIEKKKLSNIIETHRNFNNNLHWIGNNYKELIIDKTTENLINKDILYYYSQKT